MLTSAWLLWLRRLFSLGSRGDRYHLALLGMNERVLVYPVVL